MKDFGQTDWMVKFKGNFKWDESRSKIIEKLGQDLLKEHDSFVQLEHFGNTLFLYIPMLQVLE